MSTETVPTITDVPQQQLEQPLASPETEQIPESVLKLLMDRAEKGYRRGIDKDGHKVGLTFDPGAYAGVVSLAMARKLELAGLLDCVDAFYGLSAGGVNAAYAATGQIKEGMDTYVNLMPDNGFLVPASLMPPKPPKIDLDVLRDAVYREHALKVKELVDSKVPVVVGVTKMTTHPYGRKEMFRSTDVDPEHPEEFIEQMIMGCNIAFIAGGPIEDKGGNKYTDATMAWSSSVELARADGCTDILSLANTPPSVQESKSSRTRLIEFIAGAVGNRYLNRSIPSEFKSRRRKETIYNILHPTETILNYIFDWDKDDTKYSNYSRVLERKAEAEHAFSESLFKDGRTTVERIYPPDVPGLPELLTSDKKRLRIGIRAGRLAVRKALQGLRQSVAA